MADRRDILVNVARVYLADGAEPPPECRPILNEVSVMTNEPEGEAPKPCATEGCSKPIVARGLCAACYNKWRRARDKDRRQARAARPTATTTSKPTATTNGQALASAFRSFREAREQALAALVAKGIGDDTARELLALL